MRSIPFLPVLIIAISLFAQGCTQTGFEQLQPRASAAALDTCCTDLEEYPRWFVDAVRLVAPQAGRITNKITWRPGYIKTQKQAQSAIMATLQPLDIVVVSSKGRKSGQAIPGLFGHATIYTGTERQLRHLGVWTSREIQPHQKSVNSAQPFIEADAKGVHLSPAAVVLNTDRVVVLRPSGASLERRREIARGFFDAVGMDFDFLFDIETSDCTFCTELIHQVMPELGLPVQSVYGVNTILPDRVVAAALKRETDLDLVLYVWADRESWRQGSARDLINDIADYWVRRHRR